MADNSYNIMVSNPVTPFTMSRSFKACSNGKIFIGLPDTDPTFPQNQIPVYVENECGKTVQVPQPIVINSAGYPVYHGQAAKFVTTQNYSMAVYDSYMVQQGYWADLSDIDPNSLLNKIVSFSSGAGTDIIEADASGNSLRFYTEKENVNTYDDLQRLMPTAAGQKSFLIEYSSGTGLGCGYFISKSMVGLSTAPADDGGSICVPTGSSTFYWERLRTENKISLYEYGLIDGGDITTPLQSAITYSRSKGITLIEVPTNIKDYSFTGGVTASTDNYPLHIRFGDGETFKNCRINQTSTNGIKGIIFSRTSSGIMWNPGVISGASVVAKDDSVQLFAQFQDSWRSGAKNCYFSGYKAWTPLRFHNFIAWTENAFVHNVMVRESLYGVHFTRETTDTYYSFYGTDIDGLYFQHGSSVGTVSQAIRVGDGTSAGSCQVYAATLRNIGGWLESTFANLQHKAVNVTNYSALVESEVSVNYDGMGMATPGVSFAMIGCEGQNGVVDIDLKSRSMQVPSFTIAAPAAGGAKTFNPWAAIQAPSNNTQTTLWQAQSPRPLITTRGAKVVLRNQFTGTGTASLGVLTIYGLPIHSSFLVKLRIYGTNYEYSQNYIVNTNSINFLANVFQQSLPSATTTISGTTGTTTIKQKSLPDTFYLRPLNGGNGGDYSSGNGCQFDVVYGATLYSSTYTYFTEIEITQI